MSYEKIEKHIIRLEHDLYFLMDFVSENGLWLEAKEHLAEHEEDTIPFGACQGGPWNKSQDLRSENLCRESPLDRRRAERTWRQTHQRRRRFTEIT